MLFGHLSQLRSLSIGPLHMDDAESATSVNAYTTKPDTTTDRILHTNAIESASNVPVT
jgi:hypothetical protein